jgi:hypothetical protein
MMEMSSRRDPGPCRAHCSVRNHCNVLKVNTNVEKNLKTREAFALEF